MTSELMPVKPVWKRSKLIAVALAVLFGPLTWVYTYRRDPGKAAGGLGYTVSFLLVFIFAWVQHRLYPPVGFDDSMGFLFAGVVQAFFQTWLVAVVTTAVNKDWTIYTLSQREKRVSILLSVLLGPWTWVYTYGRDWRKFWLSNLIALVAYSIGFLPRGVADRYFLIIPLVFCSIWGLAIFVSVFRSKEWYSKYTDGFTIWGEQQSTKGMLPGKSRTTAMVLAVFLGILTWIYTYKKDKKKFWISFGLACFLFGVGFLLTRTNEYLISFAVGTIFWLPVWLWPITDVANKNDSWYSSY